MLFQAKERVFLEFQDARERAMQSLLMADFDHAAEGRLRFCSCFGEYIAICSFVPSACLHENTGICHGGTLHALCHQWKYLGQCAYKPLIITLRKNVGYGVIK
eukprot:905466-Prorocentrum_minimum.AAC.1